MLLEGSLWKLNQHLEVYGFKLHKIVAGDSDFITLGVT
jgi:hypothetical protein